MFHGRHEGRSFGPQLLSRLLQLNDTQEGILNIVFRIADDRGLLLIDLKDLRSMLNHVSENAKKYTAEYGNITSQNRPLIFMTSFSANMARPSDLQHVLLPDS